MVVNDFFMHRIWREWGIHHPRERSILRECGYLWLQLPTDASLGGIAEGLKMIGGLAGLAKALKQSGLPDGAETIIGDLDAGAFELWRRHYKWVGSGSMEDRVTKARDTFDLLVYNGIPGKRIRLIDHGVASGLLMLQLITMYYGVRYSFDSQPEGWKDPASWKNFAGPVEGIDYKPAFWWSGVLWGTFAAAVHNVQQVSGWAPLALDDDPLAYLGILVDILQEWDRYMVRRDAHLADKPALQGIDVRVSIPDVLTIDLGDRQGKAVEDLDKALKDWRKIVSLGDA